MPLKNFLKYEVGYSCDQFGGTHIIFDLYGLATNISVHLTFKIFIWVHAFQSTRFLTYPE